MLPGAATVVTEAMKNGSPFVLRSAGRLLGLGEEEQAAIGRGGRGMGLPTWFWVTLGLAGGVVVGVQVYKRWPQYVPSFVKGT